LRKAVIASNTAPPSSGHFFLLCTAAGLVFGKLYFPTRALTATLPAFGTYFIGFVGRRSCRNIGNTATHRRKRP